VTIVTMPLSAIIIGKSHGGVHQGMPDKATGAALVFAQRIARVTIVGGEVFQHRSLRKEQEGGFQLHR
jgi:acetyl-CoA carboxylase carboxyltransferase component